jgi:hypothetical protein
VEHEVWRLFLDGPEKAWTLDFSGPLSAALAHVREFFEESALFRCELMEARTGGLPFPGSPAGNLRGIRLRQKWAREKAWSALDAS